MGDGRSANVCIIWLGITAAVHSCRGRGRRLALLRCLRGAVCIRHLHSACSLPVVVHSPPMPQELTEGRCLLLPLGSARSQRRGGGIRSRPVAARGSAAAAGWA
jgi:hypothetical protein